MAPELTVVIPVFNEEANLDRLCDTLLRVLPSNTSLLLVDDGSTDSSPQLLADRCALEPRVSALVLARNYGQGLALLAGFQECRSKYAISYDADLEYEPEALLNILEALQQGHQVVNGYRLQQHLNLAHRIAQSLARWITGKALRDPFCPVKGLELSLRDRFSPSEARLHFPGLALLSLDVEALELPVRRGARLSGTSKYGPIKLAKRFLQLVLLALTGWLPRPEFQIIQAWNRE